VDRENITTEEMIMLILKAQTNHFDHMDMEIKSELQGVDQKISILDNKIDRVNDNLGSKINVLDLKIDKFYDDLGNKITVLDHKIDRVNENLGSKITELDKKIDIRFMWTIGLTAAGFSGLYLKLFFP
jgi:GTP-binding protein EngB required for normal cell division